LIELQTYKIGDVIRKTDKYISKHHHHQGDDKTFINRQTIALDKQKDKFWSTVEEDTDGIFDCLGMFNE
jgi:hypothetical protein